MDIDYINKLLDKHLAVEVAIAGHLLRYKRITHKALLKIYDRYDYNPEEYEQMLDYIDNNMYE
jgi:hypothetical protein